MFDVLNLYGVTTRPEPSVSEVLVGRDTIGTVGFLKSVPSGPESHEGSGRYLSHHCLNPWMVRWKRLRDFSEYFFRNFYDFLRVFVSVWRFRLNPWIQLRVCSYVPVFLILFNPFIQWFTCFIHGHWLGFLYFYLLDGLFLKFYRWKFLRVICSYFIPFCSVFN